MKKEAKNMTALNPKNNSLPTDNAKAGKYPIRALVILTVSLLLISYVETMVLPGIPTIIDDLSTTATIGSWITSIVLLVAAVVSPIFGKLGDIYGKKKMMLVAIGFYTVGVSIAGFSTNVYFLIFARAIQGIGLAMLPLTLAFLTDIFPKERLATAQGVIAGSAAISTSLGLVLGSYVIQDLGWRAAFHTAAILSVIVFVALIVVLKRDASCIKCKVDYIGALLLSVGIALVLIYTTEGSALGWFSLEELAFLIAGIILIISFFYAETKVPEPLIPLKLLKIRNVLVANLVGLIAGAANFILFFVVIEYLEMPTPYGLGFSVINTGLTLVPGTIMMLILGPLVGKLLPKVGPRPILVAGACTSIVTYLLFIVNRGTALDVTINVIFGFAGLVLLLVPIINMISVSLPKEDVSVGQGFNQTLKNVGSAIGPVITTSILASFTVAVTKVIGGKTVTVATLPSATAFNVVFGVGIALGILTIALSLAIKNGAFKKTNERGNVKKNYYRKSMNYIIEQIEHTYFLFLLSPALSDKFYLRRRYYS
jgi:Arabinose efflux permease